MKLKNYYMEASSEAMKVMEQPKQQQQPKRKNQYKSKMYQDEDYTYYNSSTDEKEALLMSNLRYTNDVCDGFGIEY